MRASHGWMMLLAAAACAVTASADVVWRVDFNSGTSGTESTSNFTGWVVSATSRTQVFANVDGGSVSSNMTVSLNGSGGTAYSTYSRNMSGGSFTNLFRDGAQYNALTAGGYLTIGISGLSEGQLYQVRFWNYDYSFGSSATQSYTDVTGGGSTFLGALTNTINNVASGNAALPNGLYDPRYTLTATATAGAGGIIDLRLTTGSSNQKIDALEVMAIVPEPATAGLLLLAGGLVWWRRRAARAL